MFAALFVARFVLGSVFLFSGVGKLFSSASLVDGVMDYQILSRRQAQFVAPLLPPVEVAFAFLFTWIHLRLLLRLFCLPSVSCSYSMKWMWCLAG